MCVILIWLKVAILARTALLFSIWVGSIVQLDTYEKRHVYEWDDHPVESELGCEGWERSAGENLYNVSEFKS